MNQRTEKPKILATALAIALSSGILWVGAALAQTREVRPEHVLCLYDGRQAAPGETFTELPAEAEYQGVVDRILEAMTLDAGTFLLRPATIQKAGATVERLGPDPTDERRAILYNQGYLARLPETAGTRWALYAILAHEVAHHLNGDTRAREERSRQQEIRADRFAGRVLARLGASLEETTAVLVAVSKVRTATHPGREQRRAAMVNGWIQEHPGELAAGAVRELLADLRDPGVRRHPGDFVVDGTTPLDGRFLVADRLVFRPGGRLVVSAEAQAGSRSFFVVAREVVSESAEQPGTVTWERPRVVVPPPPGQAASGPDGRGDGASGKTGEAGRAGAAGYPGADAPTFTLATLRSSPLVVDFEGREGGPGGRGQKGGDGGDGAQGSPAVARIAWCERGAGDGGSGGSGGGGGAGGNGGRGGRGGTFTLLAPAGVLEETLESIEVRLSGGAGGTPGRGGEGGEGGRGGRRGAPHKPVCKDDGNDGADGQRGAAGAPGEVGAPGWEGELFVGGIEAEEVERYLGTDTDTGPANGAR